jgi:hypothetical protein
MLGEAVPPSRLLCGAGINPQQQFYLLDSLQHFHELSSSDLGMRVTESTSEKQPPGDAADHQTSIHTFPNRVYFPQLIYPHRFLNGSI